MHTTLTWVFDPYQLLALVFFGYIASLVGNFIGGTIIAFHTPRCDGQRFFKIAVMVAAATSMTLVKIVIASLAALAAWALCSTMGSALAFTMIATGVIGLVFTLVFGSRMSI